VAFAASASFGFSPMLRIIGWSAVAASVALFIVHESLKVRISKKLLAQFAILAQHGRQQRLTREYQRYLAAMT
jgi:heme exporter protein D